jgi:hypothetical protein
VPQQHGVHGQLNESRPHHGSAGDDEGGGLNEPHFEGEENEKISPVSVSRDKSLPSFSYQWRPIRKDARRHDPCH